MSAPRHFIDLDELDAASFKHILKNGHEIKADRAGMRRGALDGEPLLKGAVLLGYVNTQ